MLEPEGQYALTASIRDSKRNFGAALEEALERFIAIRVHPRGSAGEAAAIAALDAELERTVAARGSNDPYARTREIFAVAQGSLRERFPGVFENPDPKVRAMAAELLGTYALREGDEGFRPGGEWDFFAEAVARCLEDESPEVRVAAAVAMLRFLGAPAPEPGDSVGGEGLVQDASRRWTAALRARAEST